MVQGLGFRSRVCPTLMTKVKLFHVNGKGCKCWRGRTRDSHAAGEASRSPHARRCKRGREGGGREREREGRREEGRASPQHPQWVVHASRRALPQDIPLLDDGLDIRDIRLLAAGLVSRHFPLRSTSNRSPHAPATPVAHHTRAARAPPDRGTLPRPRLRPTCPAHRARGAR